MRSTSCCGSARCWRPKPELRGELRFREAADLNLGFVDGRRGRNQFSIFPDSRRLKSVERVPPADGPAAAGRSGRKVIWAGQPRFLSREISRRSIINLTGNTSLARWRRSSGGRDWVICNDSGPLHLAAALGVKTLGIFGPTDPRLFGPYPLNRPTNHVVQAPVGDLRLLPAQGRLCAVRAPRRFEPGSGRGQRAGAVVPPRPVVRPLGLSRNCRKRALLAILSWIACEQASYNDHFGGRIVRTGRRVI